MRSPLELCRFICAKSAARLLSQIAPDLRDIAPEGFARDDFRCARARQLYLHDPLQPLLLGLRSVARDDGAASHLTENLELAATVRRAFEAAGQFRYVDAAHESVKLSSQIEGRGRFEEPGRDKVGALTEDTKYPCKPGFKPLADFVPSGVTDDDESCFFCRDMGSNGYEWLADVLAGGIEDGRNVPLPDPDKDDEVARHSHPPGLPVPFYFRELRLQKKYGHADPETSFRVVLPINP